jgi:hypothetical protein
MAVFELPLIGLLSASLTALALAGKGRSPPAWAGLFGPGAVAWVAGVQGLMFRQQPDYMVAYLFEGRSAPWLAYLVWSAAAIGLAWIFSAGVQRAASGKAWKTAAVFGGGAALGLLAIPLFSHLLLIGSTLEFRAGVARPLDYQPAVRTLLSLTLIGSFVPLAGATLLVAVDGMRAAARTRP